MKAAFYEKENKIRIGKCMPVMPKPDEVQIKVSYCGICGTDLHIYKGHMDKRVKIPHVMGHEASGIIEEVGSDVKGLSKGQKVVVRPLNPCNECPACRAGHSHVCQNLKFIGIDTPGAFQTYWTVPANTIHQIPNDMPLDLAALIEPLAVACHDVRRGNVKRGDYVVVLGGGPIGLLIAMTAKELGANVVISEIQTFRINFAKKLGFDVLNPQEEDLPEYVEQETKGAGADVVFEVTGSGSGAEMMTKLAKVRGQIVVVGVFSKPASVDLHRFFWRELNLSGARVYQPEDFERAIELANSGKLSLDELITNIKPLDNLKDAFELIISGADVMKILIQCS